MSQEKIQAETKKVLTNGFQNGIVSKLSARDRVYLVN